MSPWDEAGAVIDAAFGTSIVYTGAGLTAATINAIRSEVPADAFTGAGSTLRRITWEIAQADLPLAPSKADSFTYDGVRWSPEDITKRDDIGKYEMIVTNDGPA